MSIRKGKTIIAGNASSLDWTGTLAEYNIALEDGTIKPDMICHITDDTLYTEDIRPEINRLDNVKANKDLSNLSEVGEKHFVNKSQITNCITEVPQNIKLELNDGVLTLKAGSKVIVPNGVGVFDEVVIPNDVSFNGSPTGTQFIAYNTTKGALTSWGQGVTSSGDTMPTTQYFYWFDTTNNYTKISADYGNSVGIASLPLAICSANGTQITSIDQVFNGFGYIGSTVWVDKGVKGLIPNGRNEDGTLNNIEFVNSEIRILTKTDGYTRNNCDILLSKDGVLSFTSTNYKVQNDGYIYNIAKTATLPYFAIGTFTSNADAITAFQPKQPFRAVDYNDAVTKNTPHIVETYKNGTSGYRIWSDGFKEQWGRIVIAKSQATGTVTFLKPFSNANYNFTLGVIAVVTKVGEENWKVTSLTATTCTFMNNAGSEATHVWHACGY